MRDDTKHAGPVAIEVVNDTNSTSEYWSRPLMKPIDTGTIAQAFVDPPGAVIVSVNAPPPTVYVYRVLKE
jgi:hypothetical protein